MNLIWSQKYLFYLSEIKMNNTNGFEQVYIFSTFTYNPTYQLTSKHFDFEVR